jgi:hypothetical protein
MLPAKIAACKRDARFPDRDKCCRSALLAAIPAARDQ